MDVALVTTLGAGNGNTRAHDRLLSCVEVTIPTIGRQNRRTGAKTKPGLAVLVTFVVTSKGIRTPPVSALRCTLGKVPIPDGMPTAGRCGTLGRILMMGDARRGHYWP